MGEGGDGGEGVGSRVRMSIKMDKSCQLPFGQYQYGCIIPAGLARVHLHAASSDHRNRNSHALYVHM